MSELKTFRRPVVEATADLTDCAMDFFTSTPTITDNAVASAVLIGVAIAARLVAGRLIRLQRWSSAEDGRRWMVHARNLTLLLLLTGLAVIWAHELRAAALSLVAFAVAAVIAGRELIMGVSGSLARATSGSFTVGDRVHIGPHRGDVIDHSLLSTTLLEIGPGHVRTGRTLVIPNSLLLTEAVANETRGHQYVLHSFAVPVTRHEWRAAHDVLLEAAVRFSKPYVDVARVQMEQRAQEYSLSMPIVDPFVLAKAVDVDTVELTVRVPVPAREAWRIQHEITTAWLDRTAAPLPAGELVRH